MPSLLSPRYDRAILLHLLETSCEYEYEHVYEYVYTAALYVAEGSAQTVASDAALALPDDQFPSWQPGQVPLLASERAGVVSDRPFTFGAVVYLYRDSISLLPMCTIIRTRSKECTSNISPRIRSTCESHQCFWSTVFVNWRAIRQ